MKNSQGDLRAKSAFLGWVLPTVLLAAATSANASDALVPQDVSILYPLPTIETFLLDQAAMIGLGANGLFGPLLSPALFGALPVSTADTARGEFPEGKPVYDLYRVVAIRLDPCPQPFGDMAGAAGAPEIRLSLLPVMMYDYGGAVGRRPSTFENALHLIYGVPPQEMRRVVSEIRALDVAYAVERPSTLGVHTQLRRDGLRSEFARRFEATILSAIGESRLTDIAFTAVDEDLKSARWSFGRIHRDAADFSAFPIPNISADRQDRELFRTTDGKYATLLGQSARLPLIDGDIHRVDPALERVVAPTATGNPAAGVAYFLAAPEARAPEERALALRRLNEVENPLRQGNRSVDCATCHLAQTVASPAERATQLDGAFPNPVVGAPETSLPDPANKIKHFGYFGYHPTISARTLNETRVVLDQLKDSL